MDNSRLQKIIIESCNDAVDKIGDEICLLSNCSWKDIELEAFDNGLFYVLTVFVNGNKISSITKFWCEEKPKYNAYQLNIELPSIFRNKGIATKLYMSFLNKCGNIISFVNNRNAAYADSIGQHEDYDVAIPKMLDKVADMSNAHKEVLMDKETNEIVAVILSIDDIY